MLPCWRTLLRFRTNRGVTSVTENLEIDLTISATPQGRHFRVLGDPGDVLIFIILESKAQTETQQSAPGESLGHFLLDLFVWNAGDAAFIHGLHARPYFLVPRRVNLQPATRAIQIKEQPDERQPLVARQVHDLLGDLFDTGCHRDALRKQVLLGYRGIPLIDYASDSGRAPPE